MKKAKLSLICTIKIWVVVMDQVMLEMQEILDLNLCTTCPMDHLQKTHPLDSITLKTILVHLLSKSKPTTLENKMLVTPVTTF